MLLNEYGNRLDHPWMNENLEQPLASRLYLFPYVIFLFSADLDSRLCTVVRYCDNYVSYHDVLFTIDKRRKTGSISCDLLGFWSIDNWF